MNDDTPSDADRYPLLTERGRATLRFMREHPAAPIYRNESGNRLTADDLAQVQAFDAEVATHGPAWNPGEKPEWLDGFITRCLHDVPRYRRHGLTNAVLEELPTISRTDLSRDIAAFVPDVVPIDRLINFRTSGTTGHPLLIASHPTVAAGYLSFHRRALRHFGIELTAGAGETAVVLAGFQRRCFTYVSVTPQMNEAGLAKINLHPDDWRDPADRAAYLDALDPEIYTGDPVSFAELASLPLTTRPRALLSTSMSLLPGLRRQLEDRFQCPVIDVYSMNEAGPVAFADGDMWHLLQHRMFVEILDESGNAVPQGQSGEITLTGGFNLWLPLLRYRTGDRAAMVHQGDQPRLTGLSGRPPVRFRSDTGEWFNNIEVTHALGGIALSQWTLHQAADASVDFHCAGSPDRHALLDRLAGLFGAHSKIAIHSGAVFDGKVKQYTSELDPLCQP
jgi:phenylacetate-CoA ligase